MDSTPITQLPYDQRRMVVVRDAGAGGDDRTRKLLGALRSSGLLVGVAAFAAVETMRMLMSRSSVDGRVLAITTSEAAALRFPVGHPLRKVVYVGHPVDPATYVPMARFHAFLFEHKVAEALRLIRSLGADSVNVVRVEGWGSSAGISVGAPMPGVEHVQVGGRLGVEREQGHYVMSSMRLTPPRGPKVPDDLVWLPHEPLWQDVVDARLTSGLRSFTLDVRSFDDYGVNARLNALVAKSGLEAGGAFIEHRATSWRLEGTFAD